MSNAKKLNHFVESTTNTNILSPIADYKYNWRVLIVEDEPAIAEGIKTIISPQANVVPITRSSRQKTDSSNTANSAQTNTATSEDKFEVVWAQTPADAIKQVQEAVNNGQPFAMGFFDVLLGSEIDGIELVKQIHKIDPKMFAVFVTAYQDRTVDAINQFLGPDKSDRWDYMNKPFTEGSILQKARNSVSVWNLKEQKRIQDEQLAEAAHLLLQGDRSNAVAAVGRSVSHEFGNILMRIIGQAELALIKNDVGQMHTALKTIMTAGQTATSVLNKFKRQLNNNDTLTEFSSIKVNKCVDEACDLMAFEFKKSNIKVTRVKNQACTIEANHHSLVQVFINLFINASHAMANSSGQIDISISSLDENTPDPKVEIRIRDYGPGVPPEILDRLTEPLFTTKGKNGTGLGLSICKEIVEMEHMGEFVIQNHSSKGLEIIIRLPVKQEVPND